MEINKKIAKETSSDDKKLGYFFDEEITLEKFDIDGIIQAERAKSTGYNKGMPIYLKGSELIKFRK